MNISINLKKQEIVNDVTVMCNLIARQLSKNPATEELSGELMTPDDEQTKPVVARALTEAFGEVKRTCAAYLIYGRYTDDNRLEKIDESNRYEETVISRAGGTACKYHMLTGIPYLINVTSTVAAQVTDNEGNLLGRGTEIRIKYTPIRMNEYLTVKTTEEAKVSITYTWGDFGTYEMRLNMPECFNIGITETVKNCAHKMMTDYVMSHVLKDQLPEKGAEYASRFASDREALRNALIARIKYRRPYAADWS